MMLHGLPEDAWHKSSYSMDAGPNCVECQRIHDARIAVSDSKDRSLGAFTVPNKSWQSFVDAIKTTEGLIA